MNNINFEVLYDYQFSYAQYRSDHTKREEYQTWVNWKAENLISIVPPNYTFSSILEIGCAFGLLLDKIAKGLNIENVYGIDISGKNIHLAQKLFPNYIFYKGTIEDFFQNSGNYPIPNKFDLVLLSDIIEHIPDDEIFLKKIAAHCKYALVNLPLEKCISTRNRNYGVEDSSGHLRCYSELEGLRLLENSGFKIIGKKGDISLKYENGFRIWWKAEMNRIAMKKVVKRIFWRAFYSTRIFILSHSERLYKKLWGYNLFCFIKSINGT